MDLAAFVVLQRVRQLAEARGEGHLLQVVEGLAAKEQDAMLVPRALDVPKERIVHRLREIHIEHFRADGRRELPQFHAIVLWCSSPVCAMEVGWRISTGAAHALGMLIP
jgi:hypothetical protein